MRLIIVRKAHMKLCKSVSNDNQYLVVINYDVLLYYTDKDVSDVLLAICPGLLTPVLIT